MINRYFKLPDATDESVFFFGARQTGKTTLVNHNSRIIARINQMLN